MLARHRDPLVRSAQDLQSRLFNIAGLGFLTKYYYESDVDKQYAIENTLYVVAEYLGWVEIVRREVQFLDLGDVSANRRLQELFETVTQCFLLDVMNPTLRLFRGEQRAIGELMLVQAYGTESRAYECMGFAEFSRRLGDHEFSRWFKGLEESIDRLANDLIGNRERLVAIQDALVNFIDFLDRDGIRVPIIYRSKIGR